MVLPLRGEAGREIAWKLTRLALGSIAVKDLNDPRFTVARDGTPRLQVDPETFAAIREVIAESSSL